MVLASGAMAEPGIITPMPTNTHGPGRPALGNDVRLEVTVSPALANTLDVLVDLSGRSRVAIVRQALIEHLRSIGVALPGEADPVPTSQRTIRINPKEKQ